MDRFIDPNAPEFFGAQCSTCLEPLEAKASVMAHGNKWHPIHENCLLNWVVETEKNTCPGCKATIEKVDDLKNYLYEKQFVPAFSAVRSNDLQTLQDFLKNNSFSGATLLMLL